MQFGRHNGIAEHLMLVGPKQLAWEKQASQAVHDGDVEVHTLFSAVSLGSEYAWFRASERAGDLRPGSQVKFPRRMGYESLGRVVRSRSHRARTGDRVVSTYGHRTRAVLSRGDLLIPVPPDIPDDIAILSILSCEASRGVRRAPCSPDAPILITGAGTMGLLAIHRLHWLGFRNISVVEPRAERRRLAEALGAARTFDAGVQISGDRFLFGLECSSANKAFRFLQQSMERQGVISVLSDGNYGPLELDPLFHANELTIIGSSDGTNYEQHAKAFFDHWRDTRLPLERIFDRRISREQLIGEFMSIAPTRRPLKILASYQA